MIDLQPFCSVDWHRESITTPFVRDGWKYATDGRVCVRIKTDEPDDSEESMRRPNAAMLFKDFDVSGLVHSDIPELTGKQQKYCPSCNGKGYSTCDHGHDHECTDCDKSGTIEEWPCHNIGGENFCERYLINIIKLPGLKFFAQAASIEALEPAFFTFENGQGLIMPKKGVAK